MTQTTQQESFKERAARILERQPPLPPDQHEEADPEQPSSGRRIANPGRWLLAILFLVGMVWLIPSIDRTLQILIFYLLLLAGIIGIGLGIIRLLKDRTNWRGSRVVRRTATTSAAIGITCLGLSAHFFHPQFFTGDYAIAASTQASLFLGIGVFLVALATGLRRLTDPPAEEMNTVVHIVRSWQDVRPLLQRLWTNPETLTPLRWRIIAPGIICLAMVLQVNIVTEESLPPVLHGLARVSAHIQIPLLIIGAMLLVWGAGGPIRLHLKRPAWQSLTIHQRILLLILLAAILMRLWNLEGWINRFLDELHYMNAVARLAEDPQRQILNPFSTLTAFTWVYPYGQWLITSITGPSFTGIRLLSVISGAAQVLAIYYLGKYLFDRKTGLMAAAFLATFPLHLHFSRIGIANIADPLFGILTMVFLVRGLRTEHPRDFVLAGVMLGFTQYFYEGGRLFYPPFILLWLGWLLLMLRRRHTLERIQNRLLGPSPVPAIIEHPRKFAFPSLRNLCLFALTAALLIVPIYYTWTLQRAALSPRLDAMGDIARDVSQRQVAIQMGDTIRQNMDTAPPLLREAMISLAAFLQESDEPLRTGGLRILQAFQNMREPLLTLIQVPDSGWFYGGDFGLILPWLVPFFFTGMIVALLTLRSPGGSLLFWWVLAAAVGIALIHDRFSSPRYLVVLPALALLMALGVRQIVRLLLADAPLRWRTTLLTGLTGIIALVQAGYYLGDHLPNFYQRQVYEELSPHDSYDLDDALLRSLHLPPNTDVHVVANTLIWSFNSTTVPYYWGRADDLDIGHVFLEDFTRDYLRRLDYDRNQAFFLEPENGAALRLLQRYLLLPRPGATYAEGSPYNIPEDMQLLLYMLPASLEPGDLSPSTGPQPNEQE